MAPAVRTDLAHALRELRENRGMTQAQVAAALDVAPPTISSWESETNPKLPTRDRLGAYARFFASSTALEGTPRFPDGHELTAEEHLEADKIERRLAGLLELVQSGAPAERLGTFTFDDGPVTVICPEAPQSELGPLARTSDPNFTKLQRYADLDALIEMYGHLRASNPNLDVYHRIPRDVQSDDLSSHVVLLGGISWNRVTRRFQDALKQVPITQIEDPDYTTGEIFTVDDQRFYPTWDDPTESEDERELTDDVGYLARLPNPFNASRTLTICNGVHSRGVYGAVRCLTDARVRDANERYLAGRFPDGRFAILLRVPVVSNETMSPDLQTPAALLYEWPPPGKGGAR